MATDVKKWMNQVTEELSPEEMGTFAGHIVNQIENRLEDYLKRLPKEAAEGLSIKNFLGQRTEDLYQLCRKINQDPQMDYKQEMDRILEGIDEPSELIELNNIDGFIKSSLERMEKDLGKEKKESLNRDNFQNENQKRKLYFEQNPEMEKLFHGKEPLTTESLEQLKKDTAEERSEYAKKLGDKLVEAFADAKEGEELSQELTNLRNYFIYSEKYNVGLALKGDPGEDGFIDMETRVYKAMQNVKEGRPGEETIIKEELDADTDKYLQTFNGDKAELERRLRREAETIANSDTFMYFKDKIDNLPEYVKTGDPQLLDENSSLRYIDDLRKDIETDVRQTYGNSSFGAYDPNSQPPEREDIAKQLFEEYKNAGDINERLQYFSNTASALHLPLATSEAQEAMTNFTRMVVDYECRDEQNKVSREKIMELADAISRKQADLAVRRGMYDSAKQQFSREEVQNGLYVQHVTALANEIDQMAEGMELPLFMRMVQAYHLKYAAETLGADKEKKAAFARSTYNIELGHKPVEDALFKSAVSKSKGVSDFRMMQAAGSSGIMDKHRDFFLGQREIDKIDGILENLEKTGKGYIGHTNTGKYNQMVDDLRKYKETLEKISNNPLLATNEQLETLADLRTNMKNSAKEYLSDKTGMRWHESGVERQNAALGILSVFDRDAAKSFEAKANDRRMFRKINLEELENKLATQGQIRQEKRKAGSHEAVKRANTMKEGRESEKSEPERNSRLSF